MVRHKLTHILFAVGLGVFYAWIALRFWGYYAQTSTGNWLIGVLASEGHPLASRLLVGAHDLVVNIVVAAPFAALLAIPSVLNRWRYASVAGVIAVGFASWGTSWSEALLTTMRFWFYFFLPLLCLLISFAGVRAIRLRFRSG